MYLMAVAVCDWVCCCHLPIIMGVMTPYTTCYLGASLLRLELESLWTHLNSESGVKRRVSTESNVAGLVIRGRAPYADMH